MIRRSFAVSGALAAVLFAAASAASAETTLKLVTQTAASATDARKFLPGRIADDVKKANVDLAFKIYFDNELVSTAEMWRALRDGTVDIAFVYLPVIARDVPEIGFHGMPGVLMHRDDAKKMVGSEAAKKFSEVLEARGVMVMDGYWDALAIGTTGECVRRPTNLDGVISRGPGRPFEAVVEAAGAIPVPFASPEIPRALKTGAIDLVITTPTSMTLGGGHKYLKCVTDPNAGTPGMVHTSMLVNKAAFGKLTPPQQAALKAAFTRGREFMDLEVAKYSADAVEQMRAAGVKVIKLDEADLAEWRKAAEAVPFREYASISPQAADILKSAMQALNRN